MQANITTQRRGAMLLRKSRADLDKEKLGEFETLAKHEKELNELSDRLRMPIDDVYRELESGNDYEHRDDFKLMMDRVEARWYAYVFVHAVDRLSRGDLMENGWILSTFQYSGTKIVTPSKVFDPTNQMDLQQLQFMLLYSNFEYYIIKERLQSGKKSSASDGQYIASSKPYGYDKHTTPEKKKTLVKNEAEAEVLVEIYESIASGKSKSAVALDLNRRGIKSPSGMSWAPATIRKMVANPLYIGVIVWDTKVTVVDGREGMALKKRRVDNDTPIIVKGLHEPLVSEELWKAANEKVCHSDPKLKGKRELKNPLSTVLKCAKCGRTMRMGKKQSGVLVYRHQHYCECKARQCNASVVMDAVSDALSQMAGDLMVEAETGDGGIAEHERRLKSIQRSIEETKKRKDKLIELYTAGAIKIRDFSERNDPLDKQLSELEKTLEEEMSFTPVRPEQQAAMLSELVAMLADESIPAQDRNDAVRAVVERITYENNGGHLSLKVFLRQ